MRLGVRLPEGALEYSILLLLWKVGSASSQEICDRLSQSIGLEEAVIFTPLVTREDIDRGRARELLERLLGPDPESAIASLEAIEPGIFRELAKVEARAKSRSRT